MTSQEPSSSSRSILPDDYSDDDSFIEQIISERTPLAGDGTTRYDPGFPSYHASALNQTQWQKFKTRARYYVPVLAWLPKYPLSWLGDDIIAGLTVACLMIPQGLSYATALAGLNAVNGLYAICFPAFIYAIFGTSRQLSVGPEALLSMLVGTAIAQQVHYNPKLGDPADAVLIASLLTIFVGLFTFILGLLRLGFLDSIMSRALLRGFITAVAFVIIVQQSITMLDLGARSEEWGLTEESTTLERLVFIITNFQHAQGLTTLVSCCSVGFLLGFRVLKNRFSKSTVLQTTPEILLCVVTVTVLTGIFQWQKSGLQILGEIKGGGIPFPTFPTVPKGTRIREIAGTAALISIIGFVESVVISKTYSTKYNYAVSSNRELFALGLSNIAGGFFTAIPAFGSVARSKINDRAGCKTQLAGFVTGLISLLAVFVLLPYFYYLPKAVLSSIIFVAALSLIAEAPHDLKFMFRLRAWRDFALLSLTFLATIIISIDFGTLLAVGLSLLLVVKETSYPRITIMGRMREEGNRWERIKDFPGQAEHIEGKLVIKIEEPLFFANTAQLKDRLRRLEQFGDMDVHPSEEPRMVPVRQVVFDIEGMASIDASGVQILLEIVEAYHARGIQVYFVRLRRNARELFVRSGLMDLVGEDHFFSDTSLAMAHIQQHPAEQYTSYPVM